MPNPEAGRGLPPEAMKEQDKSAVSLDQFLEKLKKDPAIELAMQKDPQAEAHLRGLIKDRLDSGQTASQTFEEVSELLPTLLDIKAQPEALGVQPEAEPALSEISPKDFVERLKSDEAIKAALEADPQAASLIMDAVKVRLDQGQTAMQTLEEISDLLPKLLDVEAPAELPPAKPIEGEVIPLSEAVEVVKASPDMVKEAPTAPEAVEEILMPDLAQMDPNNPADVDRVSKEYLSQGLNQYPDAYKYFRELGSRLKQDRDTLLGHFAEDMQGLVRNQLDAMKRQQQTAKAADQSIRKLVDRKLSNIARRKAA